MVIIFDGKKRQKEILNSIKPKIEKLKENNIIPKLSIINVGKNPSSLVYIRNKINLLKELNLLYDLYNFEENVNEETIIKLINKLNEDKKVNGILVQLPLPSHLNTYRIINSIDPIKDVDGLTNYNLGRLMDKDEMLAPCTPKAIIDILESSNVNVEGKDVVIINNSIVVGKPLSIMLTNRFATVSICHIKTKNIKVYTEKAEILITATGVPKLIKKEHVKEGAIVIDAGIAKLNGKIVGDVEFEEVSKICSFITPVPGGVGPMTIAMLIFNLIRCCELQLS
jgi:methylenetetrahydrofolate dehydrogenase (NADP+)/methenyltetrahydrofolate cyclohydrolase